MKGLFGLLTVLLAVTFIRADDLKVVGADKVQSGKIVRLLVAPVPAGAVVTWEVTPHGKDVDTEDEVAVDLETLGARCLWTAPEGVYKVKVQVIKADKDGKITLDKKAFIVTITPPPPPPLPPQPVDALLKLVKTAYENETADDKEATLGKLASLYRLSGKTANDAKVTTWASLISIMQAAAKATGVAGKLPGVQKVIGAELKSQFPVPSTALDAAGRKLAVEQFARVTKALEGAGS